MRRFLPDAGKKKDEIPRLQQIREALLLEEPLGVTGWHPERRSRPLSLPPASPPSSVEP
jgi:hypothetical protein